MPQRLDAHSADALVRGEVLRVRYASGFTHRLKLELPPPSMPAEWGFARLWYYTRYPVDLYQVPSTQAAGRKLADVAKREGAVTAVAVSDPVSPMRARPAALSAQST